MSELEGPTQSGDEARAADAPEDAATDAQLADADAREVVAGNQATGADVGAVEEDPGGTQGTQQEEPCEPWEEADSPDDMDLSLEEWPRFDDPCDEERHEPYARGARVGQKRSGEATEEQTSHQRGGLEGVVESTRRSRALRAGTLNRLVAAARAARRLLGDAVEEHGVIPGQEALLFVLDSPGLHCIQVIARRLDVSIPTVSRAVRRLENMRLVNRVRGFDARYTEVSLSAEGRKTVKYCRPVAQQVDEQLTEDLSDEEVEQLTQLLKRLRLAARRPLRGSQRFRYI